MTVASARMFFKSIFFFQKQNPYDFRRLWDLDKPDGFVASPPPPQQEFEEGSADDVNLDPDYAPDLDVEGAGGCEGSQESPSLARRFSSAFGFSNRQAETEAALQTRSAGRALGVQADQPEEFVAEQYLQGRGGRTAGRRGRVASRGGRGGRGGSSRGGSQEQPPQDPPFSIHPSNFPHASAPAGSSRSGSVASSGRRPTVEASAALKLKNLGRIPEGDPDPWDETKKYCFIEQMELRVNGAVVEMTRHGTRHESAADYLQLMINQGYLNRPQANSIDPQLFHRNCFVASWNLSNSPNPNFNILQPTVPNIDSIEVTTKFSAPTPNALTMIIWQQINSSMSIDKDRRVGLSYYNSYA
jgi:hypothetical protein